MSGIAFGTRVAFGSTVHRLRRSYNQWGGAEKPESHRHLVNAYGRRTTWVHPDDRLDVIAACKPPHLLRQVEAMSDVVRVRLGRRLEGVVVGKTARQAGWASLVDEWGRVFTQTGRVPVYVVALDQPERLGRAQIVDVHPDDLEVLP